MAERLIKLEVRTREQWRQWLAKHHGSSPGIWLVRHKQHTGVNSMPYEDLVSEALCFGWVDSLIKRLDNNRYAIKVTPRKRACMFSSVTSSGRLAKTSRNCCLSTPNASPIGIS